MNTRAWVAEFFLDDVSARIITPGHLSRCSQRLIEIEGRNKILLRHPPLISRAELGDGIEHRIAGRVPESAVAHRLQQLVHLFNFGEIVG